VRRLGCQVICKVAINADGENKEKPPKHWTALPLMVGTSTILNAANATAIASREFDSDLRLVLLSFPLFVFLFFYLYIFFLLVPF
jgi:hypothetical protein